MLLAGALFLPDLPSGASSPRWWVIVAGGALVAGGIRGHLRLPGWLLTAAGLLAVALLQAAAHSVASPWDVLDAGVRLLALLALALWVSQGTEDLQPVWDMLALCMWIALGYELLMAAGLFVRQPGAIPPEGGFYNKNFLADAAAVALVGQVWRREGSLALLLGPLLALALTHSAAAWLGGSIGALLWAAARVRWTRLRLLSSAFAGGLCAAALAAWLVLDPARLNSSVLPRLEIWSVTLEHLTWLGHGVASYAWLLPAWEHAHNDLLELVFDIGPMALLIVPIVMFLLICEQEVQRERAVLVCLLAISLFSFPAHNPLTALCAAVASGALLRRCSAVRWMQPDRGDARRARLPHRVLQHAGPDHAAAERCLQAFPVGPQPAHRTGGLHDKSLAREPHQGAVT